MIASRNVFAPRTMFAPSTMFAPKDDCMLLIKDVIDHLSQCCDHCQSADEAATQHLLVSMRRDVHEIQRLCNRLDTEPAGAAGESIAMAM